VANTQPTPALAAIQKAAAANGLAWKPLAAVAHFESGLNPTALGDGGHAFGLFQNNNAGGTITNDPNPRRFFDPNVSAQYAARAVKGLNIQGLSPAQQVAEIVNRYERPQKPQPEIAGAQQYLATLGAQSAAPAATGAAPPPTLQTAQQPSTPNQLSALSLGALQTSFDTQRQANQRSLDALGKLSGHQVQAADGPDLTSLIQQAQTSEASGATQAKPQHVHVDLKGETPTHLGTVAQKAIELSKHFLGSAYVYGGASPKTGFDCSGLLQYVWAQNGVKIPRTAAEQYHAGKPVAPNALQPGDALYFQTEGANGGVTHAAMYLGDGQLIESPHTGDVVKIAPLAGYYQQHLVGARRFA
jgi:cell wall-associated NlpC family hydrolase